MKKVSKIFCAISAAAVMLMSGVAVSAESEYKLYDEAGLLAMRWKATMNGWLPSWTQA